MYQPHIKRIDYYRKVKCPKRQCQKNNCFVIMLTDGWDEVYDIFDYDCLSLGLRLLVQPLLCSEKNAKQRESEHVLEGQWQVIGKTVIDESG